MLDHGLPLLRGDLQPEAVLQGQRHEVGEDAPLVAGEEAVDAVAGREALDVRGHVGVEEAEPVRAQDFDPPRPAGDVDQAATLAEGLDFFGSRHALQSTIPLP